MKVMGSQGDKTGEKALDFDIQLLTDSWDSVPPPNALTGTVVVLERDRDDRTAKPGREICRASFGRSSLTWDTSIDKRIHVHVDIACPPAESSRSRTANIDLSIPGNTPSVLRGELWMY